MIFIFWIYCLLIVWNPKDFGCNLKIYVGKNSWKIKQGEKSKMSWFEEKHLQEENKLFCQVVIAVNLKILCVSTWHQKYRSTVRGLFARVVPKHMPVLKFTDFQNSDGIPPFRTKFLRALCDPCLGKRFHWKKVQVRVCWLCGLWGDEWIIGLGPFHHLQHSRAPSSPRNNDREK